MPEIKYFVSKRLLQKETESLSVEEFFLLLFPKV